MVFSRQGHQFSKNFVTYYVNSYEKITAQHFCAKIRSKIFLNRHQNISDGEIKTENLFSQWLLFIRTLYTTITVPFLIIDYSPISKIFWLFFKYQSQSLGNRFFWNQCYLCKVINSPRVASYSSLSSVFRWHLANVGEMENHF